MRALSYPRRQQYRRLCHAFWSGALASFAAALALAAAGAGVTIAALVMAALSAGLAARSSQWLGLARRSGVGATSEERVRAALRTLDQEGWRIHHSLRWHQGGDIDHVAIAPPWTGIAFAIETKTRSYRPHDLQRVDTIALWLSGRRAGWCRQWAIPILCLAGARRVERWEAGVAVLSLDRLVPFLRRLAGTSPKPGFLA